ncbi:LAFA_0E19592g1_1 [Lachancea sp. 'fantastica']|nr:LAFA_0E19592g1_1 [Lachancea sp. 'fantastica']
MKFIALVSGGKDSCYSILHSIKQGHELVALGNLYPCDEDQQELNSFMFQTVGHDLVKWYQQCTQLPLIRRAIQPETSRNVSLNYYPTDADEIEDLLELLVIAKRQIPGLEAVNAGAILSSYQRTRVEDVCSRLGLISLSYLWQRDQKELMSEMCLMSKQHDENAYPKMDARLIKTAAIGLDGSSLGKSLPQVFPLLQRLNERFEVHICGEGGEFETMVFDAPFFRYGYLEPHLLSIEGTENSDGVYSARMGVKFVKRECLKTTEDLLSDLPIPPVLEARWLELAESVGVLERPELKSTPQSISSHSPQTSVNRIGHLLFVSNLTPQAGETVESKTQDVLKQLREILKENGLFASQIMSSSLLLEQMTDFSAVNLLYNEFFRVRDNGPLPPSRACVGSELIGKDRTLQLSVVIDTEAAIEKHNGMALNQSKDGLHVQGRSYWAPCNIGPYSQAIWKKEDLNRVCFISGQIALVPATMEMARSLGPKLEENLSQAVLALRHFDTLKRTIGAERQISAVCYVSESGMVPIVARVWSLYCKEMANISEAWFDKTTEDPQTLIIVQVTELPKQAKCEWGGIACHDSYAMGDDQDDSDSDICQGKVDTIDNDALLRSISTSYELNVKNPSSARRYISGCVDSQEDFERIVSAYPQSQTTLFYSPRSILSIGKGLSGIELYPVERVYDYEGKERLAGFQLTVQSQWFP